MQIFRFCLKDDAKAKSFHFSAGFATGIFLLLDNITVGDQAGTNLDETDAGLWGGLIVLGYAPISADAATALIEGLPANEAYAVYGGTNAADNSGSIQYVSVRHGGTLIGDGNEINGITLAGVGSATVVNHIEVVANVDDGVEFFGQPQLLLFDCFEHFDKNLI